MSIFFEAIKFSNNLARATCCTQQDTYENKERTCIYFIRELVYIRSGVGAISDEIF